MKMNLEMKNIFRAVGCLSAAVLMLASCSQDNKGSIYAPQSESDISFVTSIFTNTDIPGDSTEITIGVSRSVTANAISCPISTNLPDAVGVPSSVSFEEGQNFVSMRINVQDMQTDTDYTGWIAIADTSLTGVGYCNDTVKVNLKLAYLWETYEGFGQFTDNITGVINKEAQIMVASNASTPRYRIMAPYNPALQQAIVDNIAGGGLPCAIGGEKSEFIEFWAITATGAEIMWNIYWAPGVQANDVGLAPQYPVLYYYPTEAPFNGAQGWEAECARVGEDLYQFHPQVSFMIGETSGMVFNNTYAWVSFPGAPEQVEDIVEWE